MNNTNIIRSSFHLDWFQTVRAFMLMSILLVLISFGYSIKQIYQLPIIKHKNQKASVSLVIPALLMFVGGLKPFLYLYNVLEKEWLSFERQIETRILLL